MGFTCSTALPARAVKASLLSAGIFFKQIFNYIGMTTDQSTRDGRTALLSLSVNGTGGNY